MELTPLAVRCNRLEQESLHLTHRTVYLAVSVSLHLRGMLFSVNKGLMSAYLEGDSPEGELVGMREAAFEPHSFTYLWHTAPNLLARHLWLVSSPSAPVEITITKYGRAPQFKVVRDKIATLCIKGWLARGYGRISVRRLETNRLQ